MEISPLPMRAVTESADDPLPRDRWPATIPAVAQLLDDGFAFGRATVLVGDNGAGKSTLVEAFAMAFGISGEGGSPNTRRSTRASESPLWEHLRLERGPGAPRFGYFLRAETMHGLYTFLEENPNPHRPDPVFHEQSHGESFLTLIESRFRNRGLWLLDEPESALSFSGCLALLGHLRDLLQDDRNQIVLSTHSPLLAALPGADLIEVGAWGLRRTPWDDTDLVRTWRRFFDSPTGFLRLLG